MKNRSLAIALSFAIGIQSSFAGAATTPPSKSPLFNSESVVQLEMAADFVKILKATDNGSFRGDENKNDPKYYTPLYLRDPSHPDRTFTGQVRARGMSSLYAGEAEFPKLKVELQDSEDLKGTLFQGARNFRVNTHLSTNPKNKRSEMGRIFGDNGPIREGLAYRIAEALGLKTPATRLASIRYADDGTKTSFTRSALLIETDKKIGERLGGTQISNSEMSQDQVSGIDPVDGALFHIFQKLVGNDDVKLRVNEKPYVLTDMPQAIFNAMIFELPNKKRVPVVYDLDLATIVTGYDVFQTGIFNNKEFNLVKHEEATFATKFSLLRQKFSKEQLEKALTIVKSKKAILYQAVQDTPIDKEGRQNALKHLDVFFEKVDIVMNYSLVAQNDVQFYKDAQKTNPILPADEFTEEPGTLRAGTPIVVLSKEGSMLKVAILDINHDLPSSEGHVGYIEANTNISLDLPKELIGLVRNSDLLGR